MPDLYQEYSVPMVSVGTMELDYFLAKYSLLIGTGSAWPVDWVFE